MFYLKNWLIKLEKVAYNMDYTVYLDIFVYFMLDTAKVVSSSLAFTNRFQIAAIQMSTMG